MVLTPLAAKMKQNEIMKTGGCRPRQEYTYLVCAPSSTASSMNDDAIYQRGTDPLSQT